jgi:hypothetical protein
MQESARASELEALERDGWIALSGPDGVTFYQEVMADEGLMVFPGLVMDKQASLATIRDVAPWLSFQLSDFRITVTDAVGLSRIPP